MCKLHLTLPTWLFFLSLHDYMTFCNDDDDDDVMMYYLISPTTESIKFKLQNDEFPVYIMSMCLNCMFKQQCLGLLSVFYSHMHNDITARQCFLYLSAAMILKAVLHHHDSCRGNSVCSQALNE